MNHDNYYRLSNGLNLESYLTQIYGERGALEHNMERYVNSDWFRQCCRRPNCVDDIPEISFTELVHLCDREKFFQQKSRELIRIYDDLHSKGKLTNEDYWEIGGIMGVCTGRTNWTECLFPWMLDLFVPSETEGLKMEDKVNENIVYLRLLVDQLIDYLRPGQVYDLDGRTVWSQGYVRNLFRGESAYYRQSTPSLFRKAFNTEQEQNSYRFVQCLKAAEFSDFIHLFEFVNNWPFSDIFDLAVAQHYGIRTSLMDVTGSVKAALFFACCEYNSDDRTWKPLSKSKYAQMDSRPYVSALGGDSRYAVVHVAPADISIMSMIKHSKKYNITSAIPIGYHPFLRCSNQNGYVVYGNPDYDMFYDPAFSEFKFRLTPEICEWIYKEMDEGKAIYPDETFASGKDIVDRIDNSNVFSQRSFDRIIGRWKKDNPQLDVNLYYEMLRIANCELRERIIWCDESRRRVLEENWEKHANEYGYEKCFYRPQFCI